MCGVFFLFFSLCRLDTLVDVLVVGTVFVLFFLFGIILLNDRMLYLLVLILYVSCLASSC